MNVTLKPFDFAQAVARAGLGTDGVPLAKGPAAAPEVGFQKALTQALGAVSKSQNDATAMQREVSLDNPTVSLEQTMVAMQKAQIGFAATLPDSRGSGIGVALTDACFAWAAEHGYPTMVTDWRETNLLASRFWPRRGFRRTFLRLYRSIP